jgi:hypothetical protein
MDVGPIAHVMRIVFVMGQIVLAILTATVIQIMDVQIVLVMQTAIAILMQGVAVLTPVLLIVLVT